MSTHWNGTIAHASNVASSVVQIRHLRADRGDDALVFGEGEGGDASATPSSAIELEEPDQRKRNGAEDDAAQDAGHSASLHAGGDRRR